MTSRKQAAILPLLQETRAGHHLRDMRIRLLVFVTMKDKETFNLRDSIQEGLNPPIAGSWQTGWILRWNRINTASMILIMSGGGLPNLRSGCK
jgi:hypothetical protein